MKTYNKLHVREKIKSCIQQFNVKGDKSTKSRTQEEFAEPANINNIIRKYKENGILSSGDIKRNSEPKYGDFANIDFRASLEKVTEIKNKFSMLSAEERAGYYNNPENWIKALEFKEKLRIKTAQEAEEAKEKEAERTKGVPQTEPLKTEENSNTEEKNKAVTQTS